MPKKKTGYYLPQELLELNEILLALVRDIHEFQEESAKEVHIPIEELEALDYQGRQKRQQTYEKTKYLRAAYTTYSFSLFERYLKKLLQHEIKNNKRIKAAYLEKWSKLVEDGHHKKHGFKATILRDDKKLIENFNVLLLEEKQTSLEFAISLFGIKKPKKGSQAFVQMIQHVLLREIRHSLTHRGDTYDQTFFNSLRRNKYIKDDPEFLNWYCKRILRVLELKTSAKKDKKISSKPVLEKPILGEPIRINFEEVVENLIFISSWIAMEVYYYGNNKSKAQKDSLLGNSFNSINMTADSIVSSSLVSISLKLFDLYEDSFCKNDPASISDLDKFNIILARNLYLRLRKRINRKFQEFKKHFESSYSEKTNAIKELKVASEKREAQIQKLEETTNLAREKYFNFSALGDDETALLQANLDNDSSKMFQTIRKMKLTQRELNDWFVFNKFREEQKFKEIFSEAKLFDGK
tara:strand:+ start:94 stop:1494 length:1401 start_codon:yes stop_codon:yes gene_type:complete